jgi:hypothetical protein
MGTELVPETLYSNELTRLCAREDYIETLPILYISLLDLILKADDGEGQRVKNFVVNRICWFIKQGEATLRLK